MERRQGCLVGLLKLTFLNVVFDWLQGRFGFGRGASCSSMGCGVILMIIFILLACSTCANTDWLRLF